MNWVLIVLVLILAWNIAWGYHIGFLRVVYSLFKWILLIAFIICLTPTVAGFLTNHTPVQHTVEDKVNTYLEEKTKEILVKEPEKAVSEEEIQKIGSQNLTKAQKDNLSSQIQNLGIYLPLIMLEKAPNLGEIASDKIEEAGVYRDLSRRIANLAVYGMAAVFVLIIALLLSHVIVVLFAIIEKLPGISFVNNGLGLLAGAVKGYVIIGVLLAVLALEAGTDVGRFMLPYVYESPVLEWLYQNNFVLQLIMVFI